MKALVQFYWDCGRSGDVEGLFIRAKEDLSKIIGKEVYFGEILGKHSEVYGTINDGDLVVVSEDQSVIKVLEDIFTDGTISGYNPFEFLQDKESEQG